MSGALSKRQQARNEKVLQDLVHKTTGNNVCADCGARNPSWASWSLGIFLCMRCATIHRKLGTHISKVKSLSMDSWSNEQVENMKKVGNIASNKTYNPENKKPPVAIDIDEVDTAMERFIRAKYMTNGLAKTRRQNTGGSESDTPPPLPPKTGSRFGFRSATSIFPLGSKKKDGGRDALQSPASPRDPALHRNKPSQVFGASVGYETGSPTGDDTEHKLAKLRDMGFLDGKRNAAVLKGVGGNLERAIETLVRLGEGDGRAAANLASASLVSQRDSSLSASTNRSLTPAKSASLGANTIRPTTASSNPFDMLDMPPALPQSTQSTGNLQNNNPYMATNPFGMPAQQPAVALAPPSQPLFPHHTGGAPMPQQSNMQQQTYQQPQPLGTYQQPQPMGTVQNYNPVMYSNDQGLQQQQTGQATYNPFYISQQPAQQQQQLAQHQQQQQQQLQQQQPLMVATATGGYGSNPFTRSPTRIQSPTLTQIPEQSQQNFYRPAAPPQPTLYSAASQPHLSQSYRNSSPQQQQYAQFQSQPQQPYGHGHAQPQPLQPQHTNNPFAVQHPQPVSQAYRPDSASIMALYALAPAPATAPAPAQAQAPGQQQQQQQQQLQQQAPIQHQQQPQQQLSAFDQMFGQPAPQPPQAPQQIAASTGSKNPFLGGNAGPRTDQPQGMNGGYKHNVSRDSMMAHGLEWSNGRHSPDAFASLSARQ